MNQLINVPKEIDDVNENNNTDDLTKITFPYLLQLFHVGLEKRHGIRLSIQCTDNGTFTGFINALIDVGKPTERGIVSYTHNESFDGILAYFEDGLTYGDLKWRIDKYWAEAREKEEKKPVKRVKIPMSL